MARHHTKKSESEEDLVETKTMRKEVGTDLGRSAVVVVNIIGPLFVVIQTVVAVATIACAGGGAGGKMTPDENQHFHQPDNQRPPQLSAC